MEIVTGREFAEFAERLVDELQALRADILSVVSGNTCKEYFTRAEAAEYLRMSIAKLDKLAALGRIRRAKVGDGEKASVLFRRRDLDSFIDECCGLWAGM